MPTYRTGNGRWRVVIFHRGRRRDFQIAGSKAEATAFEARKRGELESADPDVAMRVVPRFSDFCVGRYKAGAELKLKASTWRKQQYVIATLVDRLGGKKLNEIGAVAVEGYARERKHDGLGNVSINNELRILRRVLNYAKEQGCPGLNGPGVKQIPQPASGRVKVWNETEIASLFTACRAECPDLLPMIVFLANTGCRRGEALALTWERVNLVNRQIEIWPSEAWQPKSGRPREIPISDALLPWLRAPRRSQQWVFPSSTGGRFVDWPSRPFDRARSAAGLHGGPHTLRHTFASHFLQQQADLFLLARVLGHSDTSTTRLYAHLLPDHLERARNAVNFSPAIGPAGLAAVEPWRPERRAPHLVARGPHV